MKEMFILRKTLSLIEAQKSPVSKLVMNVQRLSRKDRPF